MLTEAARWVARLQLVRGLFSADLSQWNSMDGLAGLSLQRWHQRLPTTPSPHQAAASQPTSSPHSISCMPVIRVLSWESQFICGLAHVFLHSPDSQCACSRKALSVRAQRQAPALPGLTVMCRTDQASESLGKCDLGQITVSNGVRHSTPPGLHSFSGLGRVGWEHRWSPTENSWMLHGLHTRGCSGSVVRWAQGHPTNSSCPPPAPLGMLDSSSASLSPQLPCFWLVTPVITLVTTWSPLLPTHQVSRGPTLWGAWLPTPPWTLEPLPPPWWPLAQCPLLSSACSSPDSPLPCPPPLLLTS